MPKALTEEAISRFHKDGYLPAIPVLTVDEVARFRECLDHFEKTWPEHTIKLKSKAHLFCPWVDEIAHHPGILDVFEDILGPDLLCWTMAFRIKKPDRRTYAGWHQDTVYSTVRPIVVFGALALSDCGTEQGCLRAIPGSHRWDMLHHTETGDPDSILVRGQYIDADFDQSTAVDLVLKPGEMALFNNHIVHGSQANLSDDRRILLLVEMMPAAAHQSSETQESAMLVRGKDDYHHFGTDPRPDAECSPAAIAAWQDVMARRGKMLFAGSKIEAYGAYQGLVGS